MTQEESLLTRTLKLGSVGSDVQGARRVLLHYLHKDLRPSFKKPLSVQATLGIFMVKDILAARKKAGLSAKPVIDQELWYRMVKSGALLAYEASLMNRYKDAHAKSPLVFPVPQGQRCDVCQKWHQTAGITGNWAFDFCCPDHTVIVAVEAGTVTKLSGHNPNDDTYDTQGVFGWSVHIQTPGGYHYFYTHLGSRNVWEGVKVQAGDIIGRVGDQHFRPDHVHIGVSSPLGEADAKKHIALVASAPRID